MISGEFLNSGVLNGSPNNTVTNAPIARFAVRLDGESADLDTGAYIGGLARGAASGSNAGFTVYAIDTNNKIAKWFNGPAANLNFSSSNGGGTANASSVSTLAFVNGQAYGTAAVTGNGTVSFHTGGAGTGLLAESSNPLEVFQPLFMHSVSMLVSQCWCRLLPRHLSVIRQLKFQCRIWLVQVLALALLLDSRCTRLTRVQREPLRT
ncbi:MAG: hypothetical protein EOP14_07935 [Pseudomonas sp.]|nr:MAG: hypothetical protein EOP14_07935 [Pseudomonas sp.]